MRLREAAATMVIWLRAAVAAAAAGSAAIAAGGTVSSPKVGSSLTRITQSEILSWSGSSRSSSARSSSAPISALDWLAPCPTSSAIRVSDRYCNPSLATRILVASDGLQYLSETRIAELVGQGASQSSAEIGAELLRALEDLDDPDQDNISLCVIRVSDDPTFGLETVPPAAMAAEPAAAAATAARSQMTIVAAASRKRKVVTYRVSMERSA